MKFLYIDKNGGKGKRKIHIPSQSQRAEMRSYLPKLTSMAMHLCNLDIVHGFMPNRSPVTNAKMHIGYQYTLSMDIKDFFDSVSIAHIGGLLTEKEADFLMYKGFAVQGFPTSPIISNLACIELDRDVLKFCRDIRYTRYADDLCFSFDDYNKYRYLKTIVPLILEKYLFRINSKKTRLQSCLYGSRNITGVSVGHNDIKVPRKIKRKLRAATFQGEENSARGLEEWSKLKLPHSKFENKNLDNRNAADYFLTINQMEDSGVIF